MYSVTPITPGLHYWLRPEKANHMVCLFSGVVRITTLLRKSKWHRQKCYCLLLEHWGVWLRVLHASSADTKITAWTRTRWLRDQLAVSAINSTFHSSSNLKKGHNELTSRVRVNSDERWCLCSSDLHSLSQVVILNDCNEILNESNFFNKQTNVGKSKSKTSDAWQTQCANKAWGVFLFLEKDAWKSELLADSGWVIQPQYLRIWMFPK